MKKSILFLSLFLICYQNIFSQENLDYEFIQFKTNPIEPIESNFLIEDIDNDGNDELLHVGEDGYNYFILTKDYFFNDYPQKYLWDISEYISHINFYLIDINDDGLKEYIYTYIKSDSLFFEVRDKELET